MKIGLEKTRKYPLCWYILGALILNKISSPEWHYMNSFFTYCTLNLCSCYLPISKISRKVIFLPSIFFHLWIGPLLWLGWKILSSHSLSPNIFEEKMRILITLKNHGQQHNHSPKMDDLTNTSLSALSSNSWINKKMQFWCCVATWMETRLPFKICTTHS